VEKVNVAVIGGGPAGAIVAQETAKEGLRTVLFERAPNAPLRCAGLISMRAAEELGVPEDLILEEIHGGVVHGPKGNEVALTAPEAKAVVIDRQRFDAHLRERARTAGAAVLEGASAFGWDGEVLHTSVGEFRPEILVGADGAVSSVARWAGLPEPREILVAYQAEIDARPRYPGHVEVFLGRDIAPGFFAWAIPAGEVLRVGLATTEKGHGLLLFQSFIAKKFPNLRVLSTSGGLIPIGPPTPTSIERVFLVGDAAAQVKPITGGGLYYGGRAAALLGRLIVAGNPREYEQRWREWIGREIEFGLRARRGFLSLSDNELDFLVSLLEDRALSAFLLERGDMDYPSRLIPELRRSPHLWPLGFKILKALGGLSRLQDFL